MSAEDKTKKPVDKELAALAPEAREITLVNDMPVRVVPLKTRQLLLLLGILTRGAGEGIANLQFGEDESQDDFVVKFLTIVVLSLPKAGDEAMDFIKSMVEPVGLIKRPRGKDEKDHNVELLEALYDELDNPELDDTLAIFRNIFENEYDHLKSLGNQVGELLRTANILPKKAQPSDTPKTSPDSSETSPEASI